ncbi:hypothetical protein CSA37_03295 [Candidatus Fermentibacteria bacterium]|nr:MAG: hypothetical protein CSA37_03295 [Candidatus Fermentibacteria bacterium]
MKKHLFIIAAAAALIGSAVHLSGMDSNLENLTLDMRFRMNPADASNEIIIIGVDQASLESMDWLGWPWPRQIWSDMTGWLQSSGASVVYFDITFTGSSTFSAMEDSVFGAAASEGNTVFITGLGRDEGNPLPENALLNIPGASGTPYIYASPPVEPIASGATLLAAPYAFPDPDGTFRSIPLLFPAEGGSVPSAPLAIAMLASGAEPSVSEGRLHLGEHTFPLNDRNEMQVRFAGPAGTYRTVSVGDVLNAMTGTESSVRTEDFSDAVVLIGYTASDLMDLKPMPYSARCPGVEVIANTVDNLLSGRFVNKLGTLSAVLLSIFAAAGVAAALSFIPGVIPASFTGFSVVLLYWTVTLVSFSNWNIWLPQVPPVLSGLLTLLAGSVIAYRFATREKRFLREAFSQYLSPAVVAQVAANPETLRLGGEKRVMTAFFSDVAGFTSISEQLDPSDLVTLLNTYLSEMTDIILESEGTVDKFEGDAIIAFWGAPVSMEDHAEKAVRAAIACRDRHLDLNRRLREKGFPELHTRIGLASGPMVVGNMGSEKRFDYTIMGSDVNLASRLEGVNKFYGTEILMAGATRAYLPENIITRKIDTVLVVGQKKPVTIWEPISSLEPVHTDYEAAMDLYRKGLFEEAERVFSAHPEDPPSCVLADRCRKLAEKGCPHSWNGIWKLTSK